MELPFRHVKWEHRKRISGYVSILVLMELPFRPLLLSLIDRFVIGFNPCFNGIAFSTAFPAGLWFRIWKFQSLF